MVANDSKLIDRNLFETYEHFLAIKKCTMAKCNEPGCVSNVLKKGHYFRGTTTSMSRGSVKGSRGGKSIKFA